MIQHRWNCTSVEDARSSIECAWMDGRLRREEIEQALEEIIGRAGHASREELYRRYLRKLEREEGRHG